MKISSPAFGHNQPIPPEYTCEGENINPPLLITEVPEDAESLVLIMDDPDAPSKTWVHWTIWNINPNIFEIGRDSVPAGAIEGLTSFGTSGYGGPCPPSGTHRYFFKIFALNKKLELSPQTNIFRLEKEMNRGIIDKAELIGLYKKHRQ